MNESHKAGVVPEWLWSIIVGVVVVGLIAALRSADRDRLDNLRTADLERIAKLEEWTKNKERFDHEWRHDEYAPEASRVSLDVERLKTKMDRVERVLNGHLNPTRSRG